jgi:hypothetical protein
MRFDPRTLIRAGLFALLGLLGLVSLIIQPWTGVVLVLVASTGIAYNLLPWETWLSRKGSGPPARGAGPGQGHHTHATT